MEDTIIINGKKYKLVPIEEETEDFVAEYTMETSKSIADQENKASQKGIQQSSIPNAIPKVSEYRERYKKHQVRAADITARPNYNVELKRSDSDLDKFEYKGDKLFFGEGIEREI